MSKQKFSLLVIFIISASISCEPQKTSSNGEFSNDRIIDDVGLLSEDEKKNLSKLSRNLEEKLGSQIAVQIIDTLSGEDIKKVSLKLLEEMRLGREKYKDGVLIVAAIKDHKVRIEVGYGLEKIIKDEIAARIIREQIVPKFREGKFYEGLFAATSKIKKLIEDNEQLIGQRP